MRVLVPPVSDSRRALGLLCARRAPLSSVRVRYVLPIAVKLAISVLARSSGAACWTRWGSCARRACGLALPLMSGGASLAGGAVANRRLRSSMPHRSRAVGGSSRVAFAVDRGPNPALERTCRRRRLDSVAPSCRRPAAQLDRWASANPDNVKSGFDRICGGYE